MYTKSVDALNFYSRKFSNARFGRLDNIGTIRIAPIFEAYVDKTPEKGAKVYNYDEAIFFSINPFTLPQIKRGLALLEAGKITNFTVSLNKSELVIGKADIEGIENNYVLLAKLDDKGEIENEVIYEFADSVTLKVTDTNGESKAVLVDSEWESFKTFINEVSTYFSHPIVNDKANGSSNGGSSTSGGGFRGRGRLGSNNKRPSGSTSVAKTENLDPNAIGDLFED